MLPARFLTSYQQQQSRVSHVRYCVHAPQP
uniref:Uncharacterized protein n=1 Tax=Arundo donax TaxID=35708 RepID=A0A0A9B6D9_ARUDO